MKLNNEQFNILRKISKESDASQRKIAKDLGYSLGKVNYCLEALKTKGLIKMSNFKKSKSKANYLYYLTAKGLTEKTKLTIGFMKQKIKEYDELQKELNIN
jgi:EPS-associated MarR family transcriptional regulator